MATNEMIMQKLGEVLYPGFTKDIVTFGFVKGVDVASNGKVTIALEITSSSDEVATILRDEIMAKLNTVGIEYADIQIAQPKMPRETSSRGKNIAPQIKNFVMVSSGKGGVGKSTTTVNLAIAAAMKGKKVAILDADVYGPNIPRMMGIQAAQPEVVGNKVKPFQAYGVDVMSMGLLTDEGQSLIWRGAMIMKVIEQFLRDILWEELDILFIDMPPGTGDAQLTLAQSVPVTCGVVVTTPQTVALDDCKRSLDMFEKLHIPLAGIVENMSGFICPESGKEYAIFGKGTTEELSQAYNTKVLAQIPIEMATREGGDAGKPVTFHFPTSETAKRFLHAAEELFAIIESINDEGGASNAAIQPTVGLDGKSACSTAAAPQQPTQSGGCGTGGCGCH